MAILIKKKKKTPRYRLKASCPPPARFRSQLKIITVTINDRRRGGGTNRKQRGEESHFVKRKTGGYDVIFFLFFFTHRFRALGVVGNPYTSIGIYILRATVCTKTQNNSTEYVVIIFFFFFLERDTKHFPFNDDARLLNLIS